MLPGAARLGALTLALAAAAALSAPAARAEPPNLSASAGASSAPAIALGPGGVALAVWEEGDALRYAFRAGGGTWSPAAVVPSATGDDPRLALASDGGFDLVWSSFSRLDDNFEVLFSHWAAGRWSLPVNVSLSDGQSVDPDIAERPAGARLVVWTEVDEGAPPQVYAASSTDGETWASGPILQAEGEAPRVAAGAGETLWHLVWLESLDGSTPATVLYAARRTTSGWTDPEIVTPDGAGAADRPDLAVDGAGSPVVVYREGGTMLQLARRGASSWDADSVVTGVPGVGAPALAVDSGGLAFVAFSAGTELRLARLPATGATTVAPMASFAGGAFGPDIALAPEHVSVVVEGRPPSAGDIFYLEEPRGATPSTMTPTVTPTGGAPLPSATATVTASATPPGSGASATPSAEPASATPSRTASASPTGGAATSTRSATPEPSATAGSGARIYLPWMVRSRRP